MDLLEAIRQRHSVRRYTDQRIEGEALGELCRVIDDCNREAGLHIQLCLEAPDAFAAGTARYGRFQNVRNYIALIGTKGPGLEQSCGYCGEKIVLRAQQLGLNSCWVAVTFSKGKVAADLADGERLLMVIAVGYGENQGVPRKTRPIESLCHVEGPMPDWFRAGMECVQLAPTAMNQQKFRFTLEGDTVSAKAGLGFFAKTDLGIARYHFEVGAGHAGWRWAK